MSELLPATRVEAVIVLLRCRKMRAAQGLADGKDDTRRNSPTVL